MPRIPLQGGAYMSRSIIAAAQRCCNLYSEKNAVGAPTDFTLYPAPGLRRLALPPTPATARCLYRANTGDLYYVCGSQVLFVAPDWTMTLLGTIDPGTSICSMTDNGTTAILVDSTTKGYRIDLTTRVMQQITSANSAPPGPLVYEFNGGRRVDALDGFLLTSDISTRTFRSTYLNQIVWDSLWFADKNGFSDNLVSLAVQKREIWMIGEKTTELWFNAGQPDFPFAIMPGPFIQHGCNAPYSIACSDASVYWLAQDQNGQNILARGEGYKATPISTQALVTEWSAYPTTADAIGFCFQQNGHPFYQITFPSADKTWRYDETTGQWHEAVWIDSNGAEHRHRANCAAFAYGVNVVGDWQNGTLYALDPATFQDDGQPMKWLRDFPHLVGDGLQVIYPGFSLDAECGGALGAPPSDEPIVYLSWSDDRGKTFGNRIPQSLGRQGEYLTQAQWSRLGRARDRIFRAEGTIPLGKFALNGGWLDPEPLKIRS